MMKNKTNNFLLIDDNKATNFINKAIIQKTLFVEDVLVVENGAEALDILKMGYDPKIIFLDINMPVMNGWEFLSHYKKLNYNSRIILMVGEALTESEYATLNSKYEIRVFNKKILDKEILFDIIEYEKV